MLACLLVYFSRSWAGATASAGLSEDAVGDAVGDSVGDADCSNVVGMRTRLGPASTGGSPFGTQSTVPTLKAVGVPQTAATTGLKTVGVALTSAASSPADIEAASEAAAAAAVADSKMAAAAAAAPSVSR